MSADLGSSGGYPAGQPQNQVRLVVGGNEYGGWKKIHIEAGIERQARSFELEVTDRWPAGSAQVTYLSRRIRPFDAAQVFIGTDLVLSGYVDATPIRYDGTRASIAVKGRSKTADLVDCSPIDASSAGAAPASSRLWADVKGKDSKTGVVVPPAAALSGAANVWRNARLETIAAALAAPYGVRVLSEVDTGAPIVEHQVQVGETVFESIDRLMRLRHVLSTDNARGDLVFIDVGSSGNATTALELGRNILEVSTELDFANVMSRYVVKGQRAGTDADFGVDANEVEGDDDEAADVEGGTEDYGDPVTTSLADARSKRLRVLVIKQTGQADGGSCQDRALYERAHRAAKALETTYRVPGWRQEDGTLWQPNLLVAVRDPLVGFSQTLVIAEVHYDCDASGLSARLRVGPPDGYRSKAPKPVKGKAVQRGGGASWGDVQ
jgi:prophage tail gpP-like protein